MWPATCRGRPFQAWLRFCGQRYKNSTSNWIHSWDNFVILCYSYIVIFLSLILSLIVFYIYYTDYTQSKHQCSPIILPHALEKLEESLATRRMRCHASMMPMAFGLQRLQLWRLSTHDTSIASWSSH